MLTEDFEKYVYQVAVRFEYIKVIQVTVCFEVFQWCRHCFCISILRQQMVSCVNKVATLRVNRLLSEVYSDETPSERTCRVWFERFRNGDCLIIPSGGNHGWIPANHLLQRRRGIFTDIRPCSAFGETRKVRLGCITSSCVQMKPLQLIATNNNYAD
ncbi:hypothetical protein X777_06187 [Ooceraea biroi]|uniref:Mos1 transposase HTH domain-containing protein n=1 Tax=Ooceraea biroi TaxID=2015173 RepID=A0A026WDU0_OOCBI|nr:hypothetical protein X777_06187 [Ooceraea biroi]